MIAERYNLHLDKDYYENDSGGFPTFPFGAFCTNLTDTLTGNLPWHWHERAEVSIISGGDGLAKINGQLRLVRQNSGLFINSNVLHQISPAGENDCIVSTITFNPAFIAGNPSEYLMEKYVTPLAECASLPSVLLDGTCKWHPEALACIETALKAITHEEYGYELVVVSAIMKLWHMIAFNNKELIEKGLKAETESARRAKIMLNFIEKNLHEKITISEIAAAGKVSERECIRCFKEVIGSPPIRYLQKLRIYEAAQLLTTTDMPITQICNIVGYNDASYFAKIFKRSMNATPRDYHRNYESQL